MRRELERGCHPHQCQGCGRSLAARQLVVARETSKSVEPKAKSAAVGAALFKKLTKGTTSSGQSALCLFDQNLEGVRLIDGEVRQDLAVDFDTGLVQAVDEAAIG